jgi:hypothetical protein
MSPLGNIVLTCEEHCRDRGDAFGSYSGYDVLFYSALV